MNARPMYALIQYGLYRRVNRRIPPPKLPEYGLYFPADCEKPSGSGSGANRPYITGEKTGE